MVTLTAVEFFGFSLRTQPRELVDFDDFYIVGQLVWRGEIEKAYHFLTMSQLQKTISETEFFLPWTYPPQFDLIVAPLALLPLGLAYCLFITGTLTAYLLTLRRIAAENFVPVLLLLCPAIVITIKCGQNGFLTGTLIGLTCLGLQNRSPLAGLPLGLMVIKPHLAVAFAVYTLVNRRWGAAFVAALTVVVTSVIATVVLGTNVWIAFFDGAKEARVFLEQGLYQLFRMVSPFAVALSLGFSAFTAMIVQALVAGLALIAVVIASRRFSLRQSLGVTAIASLLISPYAYDYDLPILGIAFAWLLPDLTRLGTDRERLALYGLSLFACCFSIAQLARSPSSGTSEGPMYVSLSGLALVAILGVTWRVLSRGEGRIVVAEGCGNRPAHAH